MLFPLVLSTNIHHPPLTTLALPDGRTLSLPPPTFPPLSQEELESQGQFVSQLNDEIAKVKELQRSGYSKSATGDNASTFGRVARMEDSDIFNAQLGDGETHALVPSSVGTTLGGGGGYQGGGGGGGGGAKRGVELTSNQASKLQQLKERDAKFDLEIEQIGRGVMDLQDLAIAQNEEIKRQNLMLDQLGKKIDNVHEHVSNVNGRMKDTLEKVGRSGDKFCVDLMCIIFSIGFLAVIYTLYKKSIGSSGSSKAAEEPAADAAEDTGDGTRMLLAMIGVYAKGLGSSQL